jgi:hypothetical protein
MNGTKERKTMRLKTIIACGVFLVWASVVSADPYGIATVNNRGLTAPLSFNDGYFAFTGGTYDPPVVPLFDLCAAPACTFGRTVTLGSYFQLSGPAMFGAETFRVGGLMDDSWANLHVTGSAMLPATHLETPWTAPFAWQLLANYGTGENMSAYANQGTGTIAVTLRPYPGFESSHYASSAQFTFDAPDVTHTPEPTTMLLLGTGMVIAGIRKRRVLKNIVWSRS